MAGPRVPGRAHTRPQGTASGSPCCQILLWVGHPLRCGLEDLDLEPSVLTPMLPCGETPTFQCLGCTQTTPTGWHWWRQEGKSARTQMENRRHPAAAPFSGSGGQKRKPVQSPGTPWLPFPLTRPLPTPEAPGGAPPLALITCHHREPK